MIRIYRWTIDTEAVITPLEPACPPEVEARLRAAYAQMMRFEAELQAIVEAGGQVDTSGT